MSSDRLAGSGTRAAISSVETPLSHNATSHQRNPAAFERRTVILRCDRDLAYPNRIPSHKLQPSRNLDLDPPAMAPAKASRTAHDESKSETLNLKEKNGAAGTHQSNGKMRRVASSAGSNLREVINNAPSAAATIAVPSASTATAPGQEANNPGLQWPAFEREVLHSYRRAYRLNSPTAFASDYHQWVLTQPGSIGLYSPTIARRKEFRRQSKDQLTNTVRKHFNGLGVNENDIIVDFLHKVRTQGVSKGRTRRAEYIQPDIEK